MTAHPSAPDALSRRALLGRTAAAALGLALAGSLDTVFGASRASAAPRTAGGVAAGAGYGPLIADPDGLLALPRGFSYTVVAYDGTDAQRPDVPATLLESGEPTPGDPDGTASFVLGGGGCVLVNNHELSTSDGPAVPHLPGLTYDPGVSGGTTNIVVDREGHRVREYVSLAGTDNNCAGGRTPWNTWLTCEETESRAGTSGRTQDHGYVFEVDPYDNDLNRDPSPVKALGRFPHEAVTVDPDTGQIYETEDASNPNGLVYRWTPPDSALPLTRGSLRGLAADAGTLEALRATDSGRFVPDLSVASRAGTTYDISWVTIPDRDARTVSTRKQVATATRSRKLEGMWWADGGTYFVASFARTTDGSVGQHDGQVWFLDPLAQTITLALRFAYTPYDQDGDADGPDNITVSPYGGVILAEDGSGKQHLVGASPTGEPFFLARNEHPDDSEFTGPNFSADKKTMFVNIQSPGYVLAVRGPFAGQR